LKTILRKKQNKDTTDVLAKDENINLKNNNETSCASRPTNQMIDTPPTKERGNIAYK